MAQNKGESTSSVGLSGEIKLDSQWSGVFSKVIEAENTGSVFQIPLDDNNHNDNTQQDASYNEFLQNFAVDAEDDGDDEQKKKKKKRKLDDDQEHGIVRDVDRTKQGDFSFEPLDRTATESLVDDTVSENWFVKIPWGHWFDSDKVSLEKGKNFYSKSHLCLERSRDWWSLRSALSRHFKKRLMSLKKKNPTNESEAKS